MSGRDAEARDRQKFPRRAVPNLEERKQPGARSDPYADYYNDPMFHALVETFYTGLSLGDFTPAEVRQAAMVACTKFEERRAPKINAPPDDAGGREVTPDHKWKGYDG